MCCTRLAGNTGRQKSPFWHHRTTLSGYIFGTKACIDNRKNLLNSNTSSACPHNMMNFGLLTADICWQVWGSPANFNGFRVLAALLHGTVVLDVNQTLRPWTEGATYIRQCGLQVGHFPTFLVIAMNYSFDLSNFLCICYNECIYWNCEQDWCQLWVIRHTLSLVLRSLSFARILCGQQLIGWNILQRQARSIKQFILMRVLSFRHVRMNHLDLQRARFFYPTCL